MTESSVVADSGVRSTRKKRKAKRRKKITRRSPLQLQPLTITEVEPEAHGEPQSEPPAEKPSGFLASLKESLLGPSEPSQSESPSPSDSAIGSTDPETEKLLAKVPDVIEESTTEDGGEEPSITSAQLSALIEDIAFEEQDVKDTLAELFDWISDYFGSDHWKLTERQIRMLGRSTFQLVNSLWAKLRMRLPDIIANWCESTPGAAAFLLACGLIVVPKGVKQWQMGLKPKAKPTDQQRNAPQPFVERGTGAPVTVQAGLAGIPVASGIIGGQQ
jgi:hypothetical protein